MSYKYVSSLVFYNPRRKFLSAPISLFVPGFSSFGALKPIFMKLQVLENTHWVWGRNRRQFVQQRQGAGRWFEDALVNLNMEVKKLNSPWSCWDPSSPPWLGRSMKGWGSRDPKLILLWTARVRVSPAPCRKKSPNERIAAGAGRGPAQREASQESRPMRTFNSSLVFSFLCISFLFTFTVQWI